MTPAEIAQSYQSHPGEAGEIARALLKAYEALGELRKHNPVRTDFEAYQLHLADWGLGDEDRKPTPGDYGLQPEEQTP